MSGLDGVEADGEAEGVGLADDAFEGALGVGSRVVLGAEVLIGDVVVQDVPDCDHDLDGV